MIYLDYQATTPLASEVAAAMRPWIETNFGNPHSPHRIGREASAAIEVARSRVLAALAPEASGAGKLFFTSGATEAANWALKGAAAQLPPDRRRTIALATEHACVLDTVAWLGSQGFEVEVVPVGPDGLVSLDRLAARVDGRTGLVAAMLVNNEIGVVQPVAEIGRIARGAGALFFCDAVQGFGRVDLPLEACDMVAVSAHKVHGPKGIGALWVRRGIQLDPLLHGGGQEGGLRSGTLSPALCVGFGEAARLLTEQRDADSAHVAALWDRARAALGPEWRLNGSAEHRYHGNLNLRAEGIDAARLISEIRQVPFPPAPPARAAPAGPATSYPLSASPNVRPAPASASASAATRRKRSSCVP
jgi:cysteine desulfurase